MLRHGMKEALAVVTLLLAAGCHAQESSEWTQEVRTSDQVVVLTRGPMHEAFAQPVVYEEERGAVVTRQPPAPLPEFPPADKPYGEHVVWVPGYWSYDDDLDDFIWISGCWRAAPPGCSWLPGYWASVEDGYVWVSGLWLPGDAREIEYLPAPPDTVEQGPPGPAVSVEVFWVPGCWVRHERRYVWRPGMWMTMRPDWVWEPAHYEYTPRGYIFVEGHWDYPLSRRGMLFAPIYCPRPVYRQPTFVYTPATTIEIDILIQNLFCRPRCDSYYFGDYYADRYERRGIYPWFEAGRRHDWYDPIYARQAWRHHDDPAWARGLQERYDRHRSDPAIRPAATFRGLEAQMARMSEPDRKNVRLARTLKDAVSQQTPDVRFESLSDQRRSDAARHDQDVRSYRDQRQRWESPSIATPVQVPAARTGGDDSRRGRDSRDDRSIQPTPTPTPTPTLERTRDRRPPPTPTPAPRATPAPTPMAMPDGRTGGDDSRRGRDTRDDRAIQPTPTPTPTARRAGLPAEPTATPTPTPTPTPPPGRTRDRQPSPDMRRAAPTPPQVQDHSVRIPTPPITARPEMREGQAVAPPPKPDTPRLDPTVQPRGDRGRDRERAQPTPTPTPTPTPQPTPQPSPPPGDGRHDRDSRGRH